MDILKSFIKAGKKCSKLNIRYVSVVASSCRKNSRCCKHASVVDAFAFEKKKSEKHCIFS